MGWLARLRERSRATAAAVRARPTTVWLYAGWFAATASLGEIAYWTYTKEISKYRVLGWEFMWRIPIGNLLIFGAVAIVFAIAWRSRRDARRGLVFVCVLLLACAWLPLLIKGLYYTALLLLSAGAAAQAARLAVRYAHPLHRLIALTAAVVWLAVVGLAGAFAYAPVRAERQALAALPPAPVAAPNIVLIVLDTVRAKSLSLYGYGRPTSPNLDRFASRGLVFTQAFSTSPWTLPSHGSMFTGRFPHELSGGFGTPIDATYPTIAEVLAARGYLTAGFVANTWYASSAFGLARGFQHYEDETTSPIRAFMNTSIGNELFKAAKIVDRFSTHENFGRKSAERVNRTFLGWLERQDGRRPFFAFLNYCDAHAPYAPPRPFAVQFRPAVPRGNVGSRALDAWSPAEVRELNDAYDSAIAYLDAQLGALFDALERRGTLRNTIVVVTGDHGEQFGEHNLVEHVSSLYTPLLHVPLVVVTPGSATAGLRTDRLVSLRAIATTILSFAGIRDPRFPGSPLPQPGDDGGPAADAALLAEVERASDTYPSWYPARKGRMKSVLADGWQYIRNYGDGREELYDLRTDPEELHDLSASDPARLEGMRAQLEILLKDAARGGR
jgi:arylsulfatase A-like enzyme